MSRSTPHGGVVGYRTRISMGGCLTAPLFADRIFYRVYDVHCTYVDVPEIEAGRSVDVGGTATPFRPLHGHRVCHKETSLDAGATRHGQVSRCRKRDGIWVSVSTDTRTGVLVYARTSRHHRTG